MNFEQTPLYQNKYLDEFDKIEKWTNIASNSVKCGVCQKIIKDQACSTKLGLECITCVLDNIKNCVNAEKINGITLASIRQAMSLPSGLRWRFLFLIRFAEISQQESTGSQFGLKTLLIGQLGYVTSHPLSNEIRQLAYDVCLNVGEDILPLLTKLYRQNPWQFNINVTSLAGRIDPAYPKVSYMVEQASEHSNIEVRQRVVDLLKDINRSKYHWAENLMTKMCYDSDPMVKEMAKKFAKFQPVEKKKPVKQKEPVKQVSPISEEETTGKDLLDLHEEFRLKRTDQHYAIEEIIDDIYSAASLKKIFTSPLIPLFKEQKLIDYEPKLINKILKKYLTTIFTYVILDDNLFSLMLNKLPPYVMKLLESLVWEGGSHKITDVEKDIKIKFVTSFRGGFYNAIDLINSDFLIFQIKTNYDYFASERDSYIYLDDRLRKIFKKYLPLPKKAILKSLEKIPDNLYSYFDENQFAYQVDIILEYIRQGNIQYAKTTGNILKSCLKKWNIYFNIKEFYSENDNNLNYLFSNLVIDFLMQISSKNINLKKIEDIKQLMSDFFNQKNIISYRFFKLLSYIQGYFFIGNDLEKNVRQSVFKLLKNMSDYKWISIENLLTNIKCNDENFYSSKKYEIENYLYINAPAKMRYYSYNRTEISSDNYNDVFLAPLVKGIFFLFASLGMVNIAYDYPSNKKYQTYGSKYLTVFDGLKYVQLSDFGKYILGITKSYDFKAEEKPTKVLFDDKRLIITIEGDGRLERMVLNRIAEPIGDNYFKISYQSFLKDCYSKNDIKNNISIFKEKLSSNLPLIWNEFFKEIEDKINPLQLKDDIGIYKIKPGKQLISLIARDEILKRNILKVEDYHIAIEARNLNKVKKRLREFGFFIDNI